MAIVVIVSGSGCLSQVRNWHRRAEHTDIARRQPMATEPATQLPPRADADPFGSFSLWIEAIQVPLPPLAKP